MAKTDVKTKTILLIGDWFVDESWIITPEKSPTSSEVGEQQYRSRIDRIEAPLQHLCGAGGVAHMLHGLGERLDRVNIRVKGIGVWNERDSRYIASLIRSAKSLPDKPDNTKTKASYYQTPHTLNSEFIPSENHNSTFCKLHTNCDQCTNKQYQCTFLRTVGGDNASTWRIIRTYVQSGDYKSICENRYDWEIDTSNNHEYLENLKKIEDDFFNDVDVVAIVDHNKRTLTSDMISYIYDITGSNTRDVHWYARSKVLNPEWLPIIKKNLRLISYGPMNLDLECDPWFYGYQISNEGLHWLLKYSYLDKKTDLEPVNETLNRCANKPDLTFSVVSLHKNNQISAIIPHDESKHFNNTSDNLVLSNIIYPAPHSHRVGRSTVFLASLVAYYEQLGFTPQCGEVQPHDFHSNDHKPTNSLRTDIVNIFENALENSFHWCKRNEKDTHISDASIYSARYDVKYSNAIADFSKHTNSYAYHPANKEFTLVGYSLMDQLTDWKDAFDFSKQCGVNIGRNATDGCQKKIQIWRGWSVLAKYIALSDQDRKNIAELVRAVSNFNSTELPKRPLSALIKGKPGWGKSFLVELLAEQMDMEYLEFNITRLSGVSDLMNCFDRISSLQTRKPDKKIMVFWDEINARVGNEETFSYFLGPIWDGVYRRGSDTFKLQPCVWIFAGTKFNSEDKSSKGKSRRLMTTIGHNINSSDKNVVNSKISDFMSRINGPIITLHKESVKKSEKYMYDGMKTIYMSISLIKRFYPDVVKVSIAVIKYLSDIEPLNGVRSLEFIIAKFKNVGHSKLEIDNMPERTEIEAFLVPNSRGPFPRKQYTDQDYYRIYTTLPPRPTIAP